MKVKILEYKYKDGITKYLLYVQHMYQSMYTDWIYVTEFVFERNAIEAANALIVEHTDLDIIAETYTQ